MKTWIFLLIATLSPAAQADVLASCGNFFRSVLLRKAQWDFNHPPQLKPEELFPPAYLAKVEKQLGKLEAELVQNDKNRLTYAVFYRDPSKGKLAKSREKVAFLKWTIRKNHSAPGTLFLDNLSVKNPNTSSVKQGLHQAQQSKGMPITVFASLREKFLELAKSGGYAKVATSSPMDYTTMMLYRKMVRMEPTQTSERSIQLLDYYYKLGRSLPEPYRIRSLDHFSRSLGTVVSRTIPSSVEKSWANYLQTGKFLPGYGPLKSPEGSVVGILCATCGHDTSVFFAEPSGSWLNGRNRQLLQFQDLDAKDQLGLELILP